MIIPMSCRAELIGSLQRGLILTRSAVRDIRPCRIELHSLAPSTLDRKAHWAIRNNGPGVTIQHHPSPVPTTAVSWMIIATVFLRGHWCLSVLRASCNNSLMPAQYRICKRPSQVCGAVASARGRKAGVPSGALVCKSQRHSS